MSNRREFTRQTRVDIIRRATRPDGQPACERCGAIGGKMEIHHKIMDAMVVAEDKRRKLTAEGGEFLCEPCHDPITSEQRKVLAKAQSMEAAHIGAKRPRGSIPSRPREPRVERPLARGASEIARRFMEKAT